MATDTDPPWTIPAVVPTEDPDWYRTVDVCDDDCHHPVHAFRPARRRHLVEAGLARFATARGWTEPPKETPPCPT